MATRKELTTTSISRKDLVESLSLVKPALGKAAFVPVLAHFCIDGERITAYDDVIAISITHALPVKCAVPADLLLKLLGSLSSDDMDFKLENGNLLVKCGRSNMKVPALGPEAFIFKREFGRKDWSLTITKDFVEGIKHCLVSVGVDPTHPAQMGVTIASDDGQGMLYSTDNVTLSSYDLKGVEVAADVNTILPSAFCRNLVALFDRVKDEAILTFHTSCVVAKFDDWGILYGKLPGNDKPLDFNAVIDRLMAGGQTKTAKLPAQWEPAFQRAAACANPARPLTTVRLDMGVLNISTSSTAGECVDEIETVLKSSCKPFEVDPLHVLRVAPLVEAVQFNAEVLVLARGPFAHFVSHCAR